MTDRACFICRKHLRQDGSEGQLVARLAGFWVYHALPGEDSYAPLGYLYIETDASRVADLADKLRSALATR